MKSEIRLQKIRMEMALGYLEIIEMCERNIAEKTDAKFYKEEKLKAAIKYADVMTNLVKDALKTSKIKIKKTAA